LKSILIRRAAFAGALLAGLGASGYVGAKLGPTPAAAAEPAPAAPAAPAPGAPASAAALPEFTRIVRSYGPAVVNVRTSGTMRAGMRGQHGQPSPDDPGAELFRRFGFGAQHPDVPVQGLGSGFIVSSDGVILTNAHVVDGARDVRVQLTDRREFAAKVVGVDKETDVAVLRIDAKGLPTVKLGDSTRTQVGEWVLAIGSPFGFENSVTAGIVSAKARALPDEGYVPFLQTDVAVNPGNSGGPLFNLAGEVVGINSQIYSSSGGYQGLSFAIPIEVATKVEKQLVEHGHVTRGRLGVTVQDLNAALASSFGLSGPSGALVSSVDPQGAAARAGIQPGDVILKLDGKDVARSENLPPIVADLAPGTSAKLGVWRGGALREIEVKVGEAPTAQVASAGKGDASQGRLGLAVRPLTPSEQQQGGVPGGLVVEDVSGPAARAGVAAGDVVLALNGTPVSSVDQLKGALAKAGKHVALLVQRGDERMYVPVELG
jgi:serine protease Do